MTDDDGRIYYIDYGFSKYINKNIKKYGLHVNGCLTISMLVRSFRHHGISAPLLVNIAECKQQLLENNYSLCGSITRYLSMLRYI